MPCIVLCSMLRRRCCHVANCNSASKSKHIPGLFMVSSLRRGHANLLYIVPILTYVSKENIFQAHERNVKPRVSGAATLRKQGICDAFCVGTCREALSKKKRSGSTGDQTPPVPRFLPSSLRQSCSLSIAYLKCGCAHAPHLMSNLKRYDH